MFFLINIKEKIFFLYKYFLYKYFLHNIRYGFTKLSKSDLMMIADMRGIKVKKRY